MRVIRRIKRMRRFFIIFLMLLVPTVFGAVSEASAAESKAKTAAPAGEEKKGIDVQKILFGHILDSYTWEITKVHGKEIAIHLPVILHSKTTGWHVFSSKRLEENGGNYEGFYEAGLESAHAGKLYEKMQDGTMVKPMDLSITKISLALMINSLVVLIVILSTLKWYRKNKDGKGVPGKFTSMMESVVMYIEDTVIKPCVGETYKKFSPYLLTAFFFILINNLMALVPIFPAGVGVTANIAITMFLAVCTLFAVNVFGTKSYWKDILWPDVPVFFKVPIPLMPVIELFGIFTKPIALMVRLFANMIGGHLAILVLTCLIFIGCSLGAVMGTSFTLISVLFNLFMNCLELLVAFIQAYVFTLLSAVFIGMAQEGAKAK